MDKIKWLAAIALTTVGLMNTTSVKAADITATSAPTTSVNTTKIAQAKVENKTSVVKVTYTGRGGVAVWSSYDNSRKVTGKYLPKNTAWKVFATATMPDGSVWYNLGGNQWLSGQYVAETGSTAKPTTNTETKPTIPTPSDNGDYTVKPYSGNIEVKYSGRGGVALWTSYDNSRKIAGKYVKNGTAWKAFRVATGKDGSTWYDLGGSQWIMSTYTTAQAETPKNDSDNNNSSSTPVQNGDWKVANTSGIANIYYTGRGGVAVWSSYDNGKITGQYLAPDTSWKINQEATPTNGTVWYNLGHNQWIPSIYTRVQKTASNGNVSVKNVLNQTSHQPYADPATLRTPIQWQNSSENKAYPNLRNVKNLWLRVSLLGNRTYVMSGDNVIYTMYSSAGMFVNGKSLTPTGTYYIQAERGRQFYVPSEAAGANWYVSWKGHGIYLFHSTVITTGGRYNLPEAAKLGKQPASHGCIRLTVSDAKWFYDELPVGTKVVIENN